jgi:hypothetical protein
MLSDIKPAFSVSERKEISTTHDYPQLSPKDHTVVQSLATLSPKDNIITDRSKKQELKDHILNSIKEQKSKVVVMSKEEFLESYMNKNRNP